MFNINIIQITENKREIFNLKLTLKKLREDMEKNDVDAETKLMLDKEIYNCRYQIELKYEDLEKLEKDLSIKSYYIYKYRFNMQYNCFSLFLEKLRKESNKENKTN